MSHGSFTGRFDSTAGLGRPFRRFPLGLGTCFALSFATLFTVDAAALSPEEARERAQKMVAEVKAEAADLAPPQVKPRQFRPARMVANAELFLRTEQYDEAIDTLSLVVELGNQGRISEATSADARFLLGQAYFADDQLYSARREFEYVTDHASDASYSAFGGRAASRLVDIALRTGREDSLTDVLGRVDRMMSRSADDSLRYARAKALFALGRYSDALAAARKLGPGDLNGQRAAYLEGTALMKLAQKAAMPAEQDAGEIQLGAAEPPEPSPDFTEAIAAFERATKGVSGDAELERLSERVSDLSWLAIGRLQYESGNYLAAIAAYQKIQRDSQSFPRALYELAWTYVRLGDFERGKRALEVLSALDPGLVDAADAALLRGDLLLRSGQFKEAESAYLEVRAKFNPVRQQLNDFLDAHQEPEVYYDKLTAAEVEASTDLPPLVVDWAREEAQEGRVFAIVDDVARSRQLVRRSEKLIRLLRATLGSSARVKLFPEVQAELEESVALLNRLAIARVALARGMDDQAGSASGELAQVREERRELMDRVGRVPTQPGDFSVREKRAAEDWNQVSQELQRIQLEADHLQALVNSLQQVLADARRHGVEASPESIARFKEELGESKKELATYRARIDELRAQVEMGRVQSGFGDERFERDEQVRSRFRQLFAREVELVAAGADKESAVQYAKSIQPILTNIVALEGRIDKVRRQLEEDAQQRSLEVREQVEQEAQNIEAYAARLDTLDESARALVGQVARDNFEKVRVRLKDVVMRADIGLVQKSWEKRTEQKYRVRELLRERAREEKFINDELREVLDESDGGM